MRSRRQAYRLVWSAVAGGIVVPGLVAGLFLVPADLVFPLLFMATLIGSIVAASTWSRPAGTTMSASVSRSGRIAGAAIAAIVASAGYAVLLGAAGPSLLVILGATSPPAMRRYTTRWRARKTTDIPTSRYSASTAEAGMERAEWLHGGFNSTQARFLMMTAITHHQVSSPIWGADEVRKLHIELAEIERSALRWIAGLQPNPE
ncbi:hypothetical protein [Kribbella sp. NPDC049227]|uniref:hypothetical protein n=1 Tax=Kribbella sp. NPDC049227 TaxID=3364113 RepID=UPI0037151814